MGRLQTASESSALIRLPFRRRLAECRGNVGLDQRRVRLWCGLLGQSRTGRKRERVAAMMIILMSRLLSA